MKFSELKIGQPFVFAEQGSNWVHSKVSDNKINLLGFLNQYKENKDKIGKEYEYSKIDENVKLMEYPDSVENAAKLLDQIHQGWADKIDLNKLNMQAGDHCILGQLYPLPNYWLGAITLIFNIVDDGEEYEEVKCDKVFGTQADINEWKLEILQRRPAESHDFAWALEQLKSGNKVTRKSYDKDTWLSVTQDGKLAWKGNNTVVSLAGGSLLANDWQLYDDKTVKFSEIPIGKRFKDSEGQEYTRMQDKYYNGQALNKDFGVTSFALDIRVTFINL